MNYIEKLDLQTEEIKEVETLEKHTIINSGSVNKYNGHTREFLALDGDYNDGFNQLNETNGLGISCIVSKEVKEAREDVNGVYHEKLKDRIDSEVNEIKSSLEHKANKNDNIRQTINIYNYIHLVENGDWTTAIRTALSENKNVFLPNGIYNVSDKIIIPSEGGLIGETPYSWNEDGKYGTIIKYVGNLRERDTLIQLNNNNVGSQIVDNASGIILENIALDCNKLIGIGIYGTYVTNDSIIRRVQVFRALEYGIYIAKSWYATYEHLLARRCEGCGIAFGMPLRWSDGSEITFSNPDDLQINNCQIEHIRSAFIGTNKKFNIHTNKMYGYGVGFGDGNGMRARLITAEACDGAGVYCRLGSQPSYTLSELYLEYNCVEAKTEDRADKNYTMIFETTHYNNRGCEVKNVFISGNENQGIKQFGTSILGTISLDNVYYGAFLEEEQRGTFKINNCSGYFSSDVKTRYEIPIYFKKVNLKEWFKEPIPFMNINSKVLKYRLFIFSEIDLSIGSGQLVLKDKQNNNMTVLEYPTSLKAYEIYDMWLSTSFAETVKLQNNMSVTPTEDKYVYIQINAILL